MTSPAQALVDQAATLIQHGRLDDAKSSLRAALLADPNHAEAHATLGNVFVYQQNYDEAIAHYRKALRLKPDLFGAHYILAIALHDKGQFHEAEEHFRQAIKLNPLYAETHQSLGATLMSLGRVDDAIACYRQALRLNPQLADTHNNLGTSLLQQGNTEEANLHFAQALRLNPNSADAHRNFGIALSQQDRFDEAISHFRQALQIDNNAENNMALGNALAQQGLSNEAIHCFREALRIKPNFAEAYINLGKALQDQRCLSEAIEKYQDALRLDPDLPEAHYNLANALCENGMLDEAIEEYRNTVRLKPHLSFARNNLGDTFLKQGRADLAIGCFREALRLQPDLRAAQNNVLFCLNYDPDADPDAVFAEHRRWGQASRERKRTEKPVYSYPNDPDSERRLRICYLSPDFRYHPLTRYFEPVLANHDPRQFEIFCYAEVPFPDAVTLRLRNLVPHWYPTCHQKDAAVAKRIQSDRIDILVDLAGHTANNRLDVFEFKPAPIQATWLGYLNTTGLSTVDYRLTDNVLDPPDQPVRDTEELWRLPSGVCCFAGPAEAPALTPLPAMSRGQVTFGSPHNLFKLNGKVYGLWSQLLKAVPTARLLIFRDTMTATARDYLRAQFEERGIPAERLDLRLSSSGQDYLAVFSEIDVVLDAFPCSGGVTTCEALWMGVPVLTLAGVRPANRHSAAILTRAGLSDWVTATPDEYLARAERIPHELNHLAELRAGLRQRMTATLCDARRFTAQLEMAYRSMWRRWCAERQR